jgi:hypothetical protein
VANDAPKFFKRNVVHAPSLPAPVSKVNGTLVPAVCLPGKLPSTNPQHNPVIVHISTPAGLCLGTCRQLPSLCNMAVVYTSAKLIAGKITQHLG